MPTLLQAPDVSRQVRTDLVTREGLKEQTLCSVLELAL